MREKLFCLARGDTTFDEDGKAIAQAANNYWAAFAKTSNLGTAGGPASPKFDLVNESLMEFGAGGLQVLQNHFQAGRLDWVEKSVGKSGLRDCYRCRAGACRLGTSLPRRRL